MPKADEPKGLRDLFPELSDEEIREAEHNQEAHLAVVLRIFNRLEQEEEEEL